MAFRTRPGFKVPELSEIRRETERVFKKRSCLIQLKLCEAILRGDKDITGIARTGLGKTLTFWMPLLFVPDGIQIVVTPLNVLGKQNVDQLEKEYGIKAIAIDAETATPENFKRIGDGEFRAIIVSPEQLMKQGGGFESLWNNDGFTSRIISIVWDEAHCISYWGDFRPEYKDARRLRYLIPRHIPFYLASATLPPLVLYDVMDTLQIHPSRHIIIQHSNDRSNIAIAVRKMEFPVSSFEDLLFLIPKDPNNPPPKFLIFFDNIKESVAACKFLKSRLPPEYRDKIKWYNAEMSRVFKEDELEAFRQSERWGMLCTDSFGMGVDIPDIEIVIQWRATCNVATLWQRFGRAVRDPGLNGRALLLAEPKHFDDEKKKKADRAAKRAAKKAEAIKRKASSGVAAGAPARKRHRATLAQTSASNGDVGNAVECESDDDSLPSVNSDFDSDSSGEDDLYAEKRRSYHAPITAANASRREKQQASKELEPVMNDLINRKSAGYTCTRKPLDVVFDNDKAARASDHIACRPDLPDGCPRCKPGIPSPCCEDCDPDAFTHFARIPPQPKPTQPKMHRVKTDYEKGHADFALRDALDLFRREETIKSFGLSTLKTLGAGIVLPNELLDRIVDCAHHHFIVTPQDLFDYTRWDDALKYAARILALINEHIPVPQSVSPPSDSVDTQAASGATSSAASSKSMTCGACKQAGHTARSRTCPLYHLRSVNDENSIPPPRSCEPNIPPPQSPSDFQSNPAPRQQPRSRHRARNLHTSAKTCSRCGQSGHYANNRDCPARQSSGRLVTPPLPALIPADDPSRAAYTVLLTPSRSRSQGFHSPSGIRVDGSLTPSHFYGI